jgi:nucleoid DNA-binding protein
MPAKAAAKPLSKAEVINILAERSELSKQQVSRVFDELGTLIGENLSASGPGTFNVPGLLKITVAHKPATKERKGINPFTKAETVFKARPARSVVKVRPLKGLKEMV